MKTKSILLFTLVILAITANVKAQNIPNYIPTNGLVGWWPFNGNANDESVNSNDGLVYGATLTNDRLGHEHSAYAFNGISNYIECVSNTSLQVSNVYTISLWFNSNIFNNGLYGYTLLSKIASSGWYGGYEIMLGESNSIGGVNHTGNINDNFQLPFSGLFTGNWYSVIVTFDGNQLKLFIDGVLVNTVSQSGSLQIGNDPLRFGRRGGGGIFDQWYNGSLDDIAIWNRALTPAEITALYTASSSNNNATSNTTANVPGAISYQAVARDAQGAPLANTNLQVLFTLIADSLSGAAEYVETHTLSTNSLGLFTTAFGAGTPVSNTFGNINWSAGNKFLKVQIDIGNGWMDMGTQQLLSTPYSMHSATSGAIKNPGLPVFTDNAAALAGGLVAGDMYRTASGDLKIVY